MTAKSTFNLDDFRTDTHPTPQLALPTIKLPSRLRSVRNRSEVQKFIMLPQIWKEELKGASGATYALALEILAEMWWTKDSTVVVSNALAERAGLSRRAKIRALKELAQRGLVRIKQQGSQAPRATVTGATAHQGAISDSA